MARSLTILLPAAMGHDANQMMIAAGLAAADSPPSFSVMFYAASKVMVGLHAWEGDATRYTDPPKPESGWGGLSDQRVSAIKAAMVVSDQPIADDVGDYVNDLATGQGVAWDVSFPDLPEAGSGALVTAGEFYRAGPGMVVRVVQTHQRHDPSHTDLRHLQALFSLQYDPFTPPEWAQPQGAHDAYPLTTLIGSPFRVTHDGRLWRNTIEANVWAPGVAGWVEEGPA